ncbi:MAG TPA: LytR C-terminal domain-containing protein [Gaiellaceae bacterium]|nr:LytR C-terminal domain-containing protein [Gaiellaceae bacterium]
MNSEQNGKVSIRRRRTGTAAVIDLARPLTDTSLARSPLASARLARQLTVEEAALRAGIREDHVRWLEEGRVYRFRTTDDAIIAALLYASALGIEHREARALAGLPVPPLPAGRSRRGRLLVLAAVLLALSGLTALFAFAGGDSRPSTREALAAQGPQLPPRWEISVEVLNGNGDINWTRQVASRIGALAYTIAHVGRADRFDYQQTAVYYERGGQANAVRLARELGVVARPLPGGDDPKRLVVVVGPQKGPGGKG